MFSIHPPTLMLATVIVAIALAALVMNMRVSLGSSACGVRTWAAGDILVLLAQGASVLVTQASGVQPMTVTSGMITAGLILHAVAIDRHRHSAAAHKPFWLAAGPLVGLAVGAASIAIPSQAGRSLLFNLTIISIICVNLKACLWPERRFSGVKMLIGSQLFALVANVGLLMAALRSSSTRQHSTEIGMIFGLVMPLLTTTSFMLWLQEELRESLYAMARTDSLTGLLNRHGLLPMLEIEFERARRHGRPLSVAICDIDRFKSINDRLGHSAGDDVLREFAQTLKAQLRITDKICRWGGEEFVVMFPETDVDGAAAVLDRFRGRGPGSALDQHGPVTFSAGVASTADSAPLPGIEALIALADQRLYSGKVRRDAIVTRDDRQRPVVARDFDGSEATAMSSRAIPVAAALTSR